MNRYKRYFSRVPDSLSAERKALDIPDGGPRRKRALGLPRLAAVAAAFVLLLGGGAAAWMLTNGGGALPPGTQGTEAPDGSLPPPPNARPVLETVFVPFAEYEPIASYPPDAFDFSSGAYEDVTPDRLWDLNKARIYKQTGDYETYYVPERGPVMQLGAGFGGMGVYNLILTEDDQYLIYLYSWGSGIHRSHFGVLSLETGLPVYESGPCMMRDMELNPDPYGTSWMALAHNPWSGEIGTHDDFLELAYVRIQDGGVQFQIVSEDGYRLAGLEPPSMPPESPAPSLTPLPIFEINGRVSSDYGIGDIPLDDTRDGQAGLRGYPWDTFIPEQEVYWGLYGNHMDFISPFEECDVGALFGDAEWTRRVWKVLRADAEYDHWDAEAREREGYGYTGLLDFYTKYYVILNGESSVQRIGDAVISNAYVIEIRYATQLAGPERGVWTPDEIEASIRTFRLLD